MNETNLEYDENKQICIDNITLDGIDENFRINNINAKNINTNE